jgi:hypothetical protein
MKVSLIDENGFYVEDQILPDEVIVDGENVSYPLTPNQIIDEVPDGFWHPRWDGIQWTEGLTPEEIESRKPPKMPDYIGLVIALNDPSQPYKELIDSSNDNNAVTLFMLELRRADLNRELLSMYWGSVTSGMPKAISLTNLKKMNGMLKKLAIPFFLEADGTLSFS